MPTFHLSIITATGKAFDGPAEAVVLSGTVGDFGILAHHTPLIGGLRKGVSKVTKEDGSELFFMTGLGYVEVLKNEVAVLVGQAIQVKDRATAIELLKQKDPWDAAEKMNANT